MVVILFLWDVCMLFLYYDTCICMHVAILITLVVNEIYE